MYGTSRTSQFHKAQCQPDHQNRWFAGSSETRNSKTFTCVPSSHFDSFSVSNFALGAIEAFLDVRLWKVSLEISMFKRSLESKLQNITLFSWIFKIHRPPLWPNPWATSRCIRVGQHPRETSQYSVKSQSSLQLGLYILFDNFYLQCS